MPTPPPLELQLTIRGDTLTVGVINRGETEVRLWDRHNSWGWGIFSLQITPAGAERWSELTPRPIRHTRNVPRARSIPPGERIDYDLRPGDPDWEGAETIAEHRDQPLDLRVRLSIPDSPEAAEQAVFTGEAESAPVRSQPPHRWLAVPPG